MREFKARFESHLIDPLASVVIYVAPCMRLIETAYGVCEGIGRGKSQPLEFMIRVDDRLRSSCCADPHSRERLQQLVESHRSKETVAYSSKAYLSQFPDLTWIEQRLYDLEGNPEMTIDTRDISHIVVEQH
jgi:hypothetical protein